MTTITMALRSSAISKQWISELLADMLKVSRAPPHNASAKKAWIFAAIQLYTPVSWCRGTAVMSSRSTRGLQ